MNKADQTRRYFLKTAGATPPARVIQGISSLRLAADGRRGVHKPSVAGFIGLVVRLPLRRMMSCS